MANTPAGTTDVLRRNNVRLSGRTGARPIVFAHGFGCSQEAWHLVAPQFEDAFQVVLYDHVGSGGSDMAAYDRAKYDSLHGYADDLLEILEALDLRDAVFVGHSVSAMIGVLAANYDPSRFGALVLVGPSPRYINDGDYTGGFEQADIDGLLDSLDANYLGWADAMAPVIMGNPEKPELAAELNELFCRLEPSIARQFAHVTFLSDNRRDLGAVSVPTLVLQSREDLIAPLEVGRYVAEHIPDSIMVILDSSGHIPNLAGPDQLAREIAAFAR